MGRFLFFMNILYQNYHLSCDQRAVKCKHIPLVSRPHLASAILEKGLLILVKREILDPTSVCSTLWLNLRGGQDEVNPVA